MTIANKLAARLPVPADDLASDGMIGLVSAVERFEPERGNTFGTFAGPWINGAILDAVCKRDCDVGRQARGRQRVQSEAVDAFHAEHGRWPSESELDAVLPAMTPAVRSNWRDHFQRTSPTSLDVTRTDPDGREVMRRDLIEAGGASHTARVDDRDEMTAMLAGLPPSVVATLTMILDDTGGLIASSRGHGLCAGRIAAARGVSKSSIGNHIRAAREHFAAFRAGRRTSAAAQRPQQHPVMLLIAIRSRRTLIHSSRGGRNA